MNNFLCSSERYQFYAGLGSEYLLASVLVPGVSTPASSSLLLCPLHTIWRASHPSRCPGGRLDSRHGRGLPRPAPLAALHHGGRGGGLHGEDMGHHQEWVLDREDQGRTTSQQQLGTSQDQGEDRMADLL